MKDHELEAYLLASRPADRAYTVFTLSVLDGVRQSAHGLSYEKQSLWQAARAFIQRSMLRKAVALALVILVTAFIGLSGYAYANGTNPFSLIKRWVVGEQVKVTYQDPQTKKQREFSHGAKRSYSDLAVSAFAEVSLIDLLHFHATHSYEVPKNGIEYIGDPFRTDYIYPRVGTIEQITEENVVVHLTYSVGRSKVEASRNVDERITIPRSYFYYYNEGKLTTVQQSAVGKLIEVFQNQYLKHRQHSGERPVPVDLYSAFALSHSFDSIKEATTTKGPASATTDTELQEMLSQQDIFETGVGAWAETCLSNGADTCPHAFRNEQAGENFFSASITPGVYGGPSRQNPNIIPYGEGVATHTAETRQYVLRHIEGRITKITGDRITIKTSSGGLWAFQYSVENQQAFAKEYASPLKPGQLLAGGVIASVYNWDQRSFDNQYVFGMSRYK
jgi:hypothetical protein